MVRAFSAVDQRKTAIFVTGARPRLVIAKYPVFLAVDSEQKMAVRILKWPIIPLNDDETSIVIRYFWFKVTRVVAVTLDRIVRGFWNWSSDESTSRISGLFWESRAKMLWFGFTAGTLHKIYVSMYSQEVDDSGFWSRAEPRYQPCLGFHGRGERRNVLRLHLIKTSRK